MRKAELTITFTDDDGNTRERKDFADLIPDQSNDGEHRVFHILMTELRVMAGEQRAPKHNAIAQSWLEFPGKLAEAAHFVDILNSQAIWFELTNLVMGRRPTSSLPRGSRLLNRPTNHRLKMIARSMISTTFTIVR